MGEKGMRLGSRVLITGGGDGIGFFIAAQLLEDRHRVAVLDIGIGRLEALAEKHGDALLAYQGDVTSAADVDACVAAMVGRWGGVDVRCTMRAPVPSRISTIRRMRFLPVRWMSTTTAR